MFFLFLSICFILIVKIHLKGISSFQIMQNKLHCKVEYKIILFVKQTLPLCQEEYDKNRSYSISTIYSNKHIHLHAQIDTHTYHKQNMHRQSIDKHKLSSLGRCTRQLIIWLKETKIQCALTQMDLPTQRTGCGGGCEFNSQVHVQVTPKEKERNQTAR